MKNAAIGFVLGILVSAGCMVWKASQAPEAVPGEVLPEILGQVATPEIRTVYLYRDAKKPRGAPTGSEALTAVKTDTGTATTLLDAAGHASIVLQTDPATWFGKTRKQTVTVIYGSMAGEMVSRLEYRYDLWQVKNLNIGLAAETNLGASQGHRAIIGVGLSYRW